MKTAKDLTREQLETIVTEMQECLFLQVNGEEWHWDRDKEWKGADVCDTLCGVLAEHGLVPDEEEDAIGRLVALAKELGLPDYGLDDAVYDMACDEDLAELNAAEGEDEQEEIICSAENRASNINNCGLEEQIRYLLTGNDAATVEELIRKNADQ